MIYVLHIFMEIVYHRNEYESIYLIYVSLENSNLTILVPEDTSDEQLQAIGQKFLEAYIITDISQVKRGTCSMPDDPMPDIAEILSAYGI